MARAVLTLLSFQSIFATIILFLIPMNSVLSRIYRRPNSNTSIASQSPTRGIISTLMSRAGERILANQAEWWHSTDLTSSKTQSADLRVNSK
ncbi:unnamed protein product [Rhizophagus irregularis]|uniref:Uncharacterized protein n=1 Tax=Rhizophagus irregularis TaxID=588596 RepID=A0A2I1GU14_9GLOM|nr:hypothetical protein RhiirA4_466404 [Rhizophagus irregularis]CAB4445171.1 unnamed protein product [Rhizophagus irregularis]